MANRGKRCPCRVCSALLAVDNHTDICSPCARAKVADHGQVPTPADEFWDHPGIKKALRARDFGGLLREYRQGHQPVIKQSEIAEWLGITQGQVSRIERGATPVRDLDKLDRWARVLKIPQRCLWFSLSPQSSDAYPPDIDALNLPSTSDPNGDDDVRRRQFLTVAGTGATSVGASLLRSPATASASSGSGHAIGNPDVELVREVTSAFRRVDNKYGGGHSRSALTSYLNANVEPMLHNGRAQSTVRDELFTAAAELHQLAGWMAYDTGHANAGQNHMRTALRLCQKAGDNALSAEMLAGMSHHAAFHGAPESAVDLALAARQMARQTGLPALKSESAVMEAHGLALQGDKQGCLAALRDAENAFSAIDHADSPQWLAYFDGAYLSAKFAHTFRDLGRPKDAELFARRSLEMSDGYQRGRLFNTALLASILADIGKIDEACAHGATAVQMTGTVRSVRSATYLADLARRLTPYRANAAVRSLYWQMIDVGIPVPTG